MILERIRQHYEELTRSQRRIADFVASSYHEAAFMTASLIAQRMGLNEATVVRFAQRLGYSGYPGMSIEIQDLVQRELGADTEVASPTEGDPISTLVAEVYGQKIAPRSPETVAAEDRNRDDVGTIADTQTAKECFVAQDFLRVD